MIITKSIAQFKTNIAGNLSIFSAISLPVIVLAVGTSVDISELVRRKTNLQNATDIAILAAARSGEETQEQLHIIAQETFNENFFFNPGENLETFELTLSPNDEVKLVTRLKRPTTIMHFAGFHKQFASVESVTHLPQTSSIDIAFVLDRTGSMAGANMAGLKSAADSLLQKFSVKQSDVRISVTPFAGYVNIGVANKNKRWLGLPTFGPEIAGTNCEMIATNTSTCSLSTANGNPSPSPTPNSASSSTNSGPTLIGSGPTINSCSTTSTTNCPSGFDPGYSWSDISQNSDGSYCTTTTVPAENSGDLTEECRPDSISANWFGCVGSRKAPYNQQAAYNSEEIPPIYDRTCGQEITPLTENLATVSTAISKLTASGATYIPAGLQWGWRSLTAQEPLEIRPQPERKKLLILMTDGANTLSQSGELHNGRDYAAADSQTTALCTAIKADDIQVATVSYSASGRSGANSRMLSQCASSGDLYFEAKSAGALADAFESAINQVNEVRLVR